MGWLDGVSQHPIFASSSSDEEAVRSQRVALVRNSELLVARGRELRIASLIDTKSRHDAGRASAQSYKVRPHLALLHRVELLQTVISPALDFEIRYLAVNPTSKLVAVIGEHRAAVVVLPRKGWNILVGTTLELNAIRVDQARFTDGGSRIVQAKWHHWSKDGTTLLVMTQDGYLREYDLAIDAEQPCETIDFRPSVSNISDTTFDAYEDGDAACSFCIGSGSGWGAMTLYALFHDGTVTSICPYAPKNAAVPLPVLEALLSSAQAQLDHLSKHSDSLLVEEKQRSLHAQSLLQFASGLLRAARMETLDTNGADAFNQALIKKPSNPRLRGPYLLQPAPRQLRNVDDASASDIIASAVSDDSVVVVLLIAYNDGRVNVFLDLGVTAASFASSALPLLVTMETIDLGISSDCNAALPTLLADRITNTTFHVHHACGIQTIDLPASLGGLLDGSVTKERWREAITSAGSSEINWRIRTARSCAVTGTAVVNDVYLGHVLIVQLQSGRGVALDVGTSIEEDDVLTTQSPPRVASQKSGYVSVLREPIFVPSQITLSLRPAISGPPGTASTTTLQDLGRIIETIRHDIRAIVDATNTTQNRLRRQLAELPRQIAKLQEVRQRIERSDIRMGGERLSKAADAQEKLTLRADRFLQSLMQAHAPGVSDAERAWFAELARLKGEVERRIVRRISELNEAVHALRPRVRAYAEESSGEGRLGERQVRSVEAQLLAESRLIDSAKAQIENLSASFLVAM